MDANNAITKHSNTPPLPHSNTKLILILAILLLNVFCANTVRIEPDYTKTPVFFVHGYGMPAKSWEPIISYLTRHGYPRSYLKAINLRPNNGSNIVAAEEQIAPAIEEFLMSINQSLTKEQPTMPLKTKIDLISHSMGGLSSRWYTAKVRPDRVRKWISLAGANHGTNDVCPPKFISPGADELCPAYARNRKESLIQYVLNGLPGVADVDETPYGLGTDSSGVTSISPDQNSRVLYITIRTTDDEWIDPGDSVILDGAGGQAISIPYELPAEMTSHGNILMTNCVGHDAMLKDADTMKLVGILLSTDWEAI